MSRENLEAAAALHERSFAVWSELRVEVDERAAHVSWMRDGPPC